MCYWRYNQTESSLAQKPGHMQGANDREIWQDADNHWRGGAQAGSVSLRSEVDTVAEDVVVVENDVAEIDADAEMDASLGSHAGVARGHLALHLDRTTNRVDHARKLAEQTIARRVDDATTVLLDLGVGNLSPAFSAQRACLPRPPHQA